MALLRPCIISGGYRLKSDEFIPGARSCFSWVQCRPCQWCSGRSVAKTVDCPSSHSSKCIKVRPIVLHHACTAWVCHMVEHRLALGLVEHSLGSSGCSKKHQGGPGLCISFLRCGLGAAVLARAGPKTTTDRMWGWSQTRFHLLLHIFLSVEARGEAPILQISWVRPVSNSISSSRFSCLAHLGGLNRP